LKKEGKQVQNRKNKCNGSWGSNLLGFSDSQRQKKRLVQTNEKNKRGKGKVNTLINITKGGTNNECNNLQDNQGKVI